MNFDSFISKLSQYNIFTNLIPGTILCLVLEYVVGYEVLITDNTFFLFVVFYFSGIVANRISSLVVSPLLQLIHVVSLMPYDEYVKAEKQDSKIAILSQENNMFRAFAGVFAISIIAKLIAYIPFVQNNGELFLILGLFTLFVLAYRKQTNFIKKRIEEALNNK